jgi:hypothetical protein
MRITSCFISLLASLITLASGVKGLAQESNLKDLVVLGQVKWGNYGFSYEISEISKMPNDDPRLIAGYIVVLHAESISEDLVQAFADDIQRRGDAAGLILLKIMKDRSSWTRMARENIFFKLDRYPRFDHRPFIEAAREIWLENKFKTPSRMCHAICGLLATEGDASDIHIVQEMTYPNGEVPLVSAGYLKLMRKRLSGNLLPSEWNNATGMPPAEYEWIDPQSKKAWRFVGTAKPEAKRLPTHAHEELISSTLWSIIVVLIVAGCGLLWWVLKRRS